MLELYYIENRVLTLKAFEKCLWLKTVELGLIKECEDRKEIFDLKNFFPSNFVVVNDDFLKKKFFAHTHFADVLDDSEHDERKKKILKFLTKRLKIA